MIYFRPAPMLLVEPEVGPTVCPGSDTGILSQRYPVPHKLTHQQKPRPRCRLIEHDFELLWITAAGAKTLSGIRNLPIDCAMFHNEPVLHKFNFAETLLVPIRRESQTQTQPPTLDIPILKK